ncbi:MAG: D-alanine--D-alanine ligase [Ekhidna sp.]
MKRVLILCGGQSPEHPISIRSCKNILAEINRDKYSISIIGINQGGVWRLIDESDLEETITDEGDPVEIRPGLKDCFWSSGSSLGDFDVVFPILHGPNGEDGTIQGLLSLLGLPFVGPGVLASAVSMDKDITKRLLKQEGIKVAEWLLLQVSSSNEDFNTVSAKLGTDLFVKPANMGSSVGVHHVTSEKEWDTALKDAFKYDTRVLVEKAIKGKELECAVLGNADIKVTGVGEVSASGFYSYTEKYDDTSEAQIMIPANIDEQHIPLLKSTAAAAYKALACEGMSRVDMFLTEDGEVLVNEVNTIPGFTSISMYPQLWQQEGLSYTALIDQLLELAIERRNKSI